MSKKKTVTMFVVDLSPNMGDVRGVDCVPGKGGKKSTEEVTHLEWGLRYVKKQIQEKILHGDKTDRCGVVVYGSECTDDVLNDKTGEYPHVQTYLPIDVPQPYMLAKLNELRTSESTTGDAIDGLVVALETQSRYLVKAQTWAREVVLVTDGNSQFDHDGWEAVVRKINIDNVHLTVVGIDFDMNPEKWYSQRGGQKKSTIKKSNEELFGRMVKATTGKKAVVQNLVCAPNDAAPPRIKVINSTLVSTMLRIGDPRVSADSDYPTIDGADAIEIAVKTSKATAIQRPATMKKFTCLAGRSDDLDAMDVDNKDEVFAAVKARTVYTYEVPDDEDEASGSMRSTSGSKGKEPQSVEVDKEEVVRAYKYGETFVPCLDSQYLKLPTKAGITVCGFFPSENFRPELAMGETHYIWGDPKSAKAQVALSSFARAMRDQNRLAIAKWVPKDGADAKMGVLVGGGGRNVDCLLWSQMPFAEDVRQYAFASLENLVSKEGKKVKEHAYNPTKKQCDAMDAFVDSMDLMDMGEKGGDGNRKPWFNPRESFNPAIHRTKEAILHVAAVPDLKTHPLPPPHPELTKFFQPPGRAAVKRAKPPLEACIKAFDVKRVPKRAPKLKDLKYSHAAEEDDSEVLLLDQQKGKLPKQVEKKNRPVPSTSAKATSAERNNNNDSETEPESDEGELLLDRKSAPSNGVTSSRVFRRS